METNRRSVVENRQSVQPKILNAAKRGNVVSAPSVGPPNVKSVVGISMRNNDGNDERPLDDDDHDLRILLDYPSAGLIASAPGGLARFARAIEAVREE